MSKKKERVTKLSDEEFFAAVREAGGIYSRAVVLIKKKFGIDITRQSVRERCLSNPEIMQDIKEQNIDVALEGLHSLLKSDDEKVKLGAVKYYLNNQAKHLGFNEGNKEQPPTKLEIEIIRK